MKLRVLSLVLYSVLTVAPAHAGLFTDDEAQKKIKTLETRVSQLEETESKQAAILLDLQGQIEAQNTEIRRLRGQNEELQHGLQDAEKRQKDFYVDLDSRLRRFEAAEAALQPQASATGKQPEAANDPSLENRAYEAAYAFYKSASYQNALGAFQDFLTKFPQSVYAPNSYFWMGQAYTALKDCKSALPMYQMVVDKYDNSPKLPDALYGVANCQAELDKKPAAKKTLKLIVSKYPDTSAAEKAKKLLGELK